MGAARLAEPGNRDEIVQVALAAIRGQGGEKVSHGLAARIHQEVRRIVKLKGDAHREAAATLARELLGNPQLRPDVDRFRASHPAKVRGSEEQRLVATVAKSIEHAADCHNFRQANTARQMGQRGLSPQPERLYQVPAGKQNRGEALELRASPLNFFSSPAYPSVSRAGRFKSADFRANSTVNKAIKANKGVGPSPGGASSSRAGQNPTLEVDHGYHSGVLHPKGRGRPG